MRSWWAICRWASYGSVGAALIAAVALAPAAAATGSGASSFRFEVFWAGSFAPCASGVPATIGCYPRAGGPVLVPGLGLVRQSYVYPIESNPAACMDGFHVLAYPVRLVVEGKGEIYLSVHASEECLYRLPSLTVLAPTQTFTVSGGSGAYTGASGSGVVRRRDTVRDPVTARTAGKDLWEATLVVPGVEFDLVPPTMRGAAPRVVRAPRKARTVRVTYTITATDDVDDRVRVVCNPGSGSRFKVGRRTQVRCLATDASGNTAVTAFTVTVKRRRQAAVRRGSSVSTHGRSRGWTS
jgi:HYR domain